MRENRNLNYEILEARQLLDKNPILVMRDKYTRKPLGIGFSEAGLRSSANKNGVYLYCEGRVTDLKEAQRAKKSPNVIVERFTIKDNLQGKQLTDEILWINKAKHYIRGY